MDQNPTKEPRPPVNLRIKFRSENVDQFIERYAVDVSRGGIFIRTREPLAVGTHLKLDFQFQNGNALMSGDGTVVWIREFDPNRTNVPPGMGVRFDKLSPESQAVLEQLLTEKAKRERGGSSTGAPGSAASGGPGGVAVRRPSSMFSVLESQTAAEGGTKTAVAPTTTSTSATTTTAATTPRAPAAGSASLAEKLAAKSAGAAKPDAQSPAYRPLGTTKNPFSGTPATGSPTASTGSGPTKTSTPSAAAASPPAPGARPLSDLLPLFASKPPTPAAPAPDPSADGHGFDDLNDEPTQIAGRLPSFLLSDSDATTEVPSDLAEAVKTAAPLPADYLPGASPDSERPRAAKAKASLDQPPPAAAETKVEEKKAETAAAPAAEAAKTDAAAPAAAPPAAASAKKRSAVPVVAAVLVLGVSAIFLIKFFGSNSTEKVVPAPAPSAPAAAIAPAEPAAPAPAAPAPDPNAAAAPPAAVAPAEATPPPAAAAPEPPKPAVEEKPAASAEEPAEAARKPVAKKKPRPVAAAAEPAAATDTAAAPAAGAAAAPGDSAEAVVHQVKVTSKPAGADVLLDGQSVGKTPFSVGIADINAPHAIAVRKEGFEPFEQMIGASSAWTKTKAPKGKPAVSVLKLNAKLKPIGGAAPEAKATEPPAASDEGAAKTEPPKAERPMAPAELPAENQ